MNWVKNVKTVSTFPPAETFNKPAKSIAKTMADPRVSPKGLGSAIRMVQYFINRGGKNLSAARKRELEKAKHLLQDMREHEGNDAAAKPRSKDHDHRPRTKASGRTNHSTRSRTNGFQRSRARKAQ